MFDALVGICPQNQLELVPSASMVNDVLISRSVKQLSYPLLLL